MGLMSRASIFLNNSLNTAAGVEVVYARGVVAASLTAWVGNEIIQTLEPMTGTRLDDRERDYLVDYAEMSRTGFDEPAVGDVVIETINGVDVQWEIRPNERGPAWRWSDTGRTRYRFRTRRLN
jgi:hypothetical protein